jgi:Uma2 family endonuclease
VAAPAPPLAAKARRGEPDQRVLLRGVTWKEYETILAIRGDAVTPRMTYLAGDLELLAPSIDHETITGTLARLVEAYADAAEFALHPYGAWTVRHPGRARAIEPDACYAVGGLKTNTPDLAIEVVWTPGGLDKLEVYQGLGVREVWLWQHDHTEVHSLRARGYKRVTQSELFPALDVGLLARFAMRPGSAAVRAFLTALREA